LRKVNSIFTLAFPGYISFIFLSDGNRKKTLLLFPTMLFSTGVLAVVQMLFLSPVFRVLVVRSQSKVFKAKICVLVVRSHSQVFKAKIMRTVTMVV